MKMAAHQTTSLACCSISLPPIYACSQIRAKSEALDRGDCGEFALGRDDSELSDDVLCVYVCVCVH